MLQSTWQCQALIGWRLRILVIKNANFWAPMSHVDCATEISDNLAPIIALLDGNFVLTNCWVPKHNFPPHNIDLVILPSQENNFEWFCEVNLSD